jgi:hypothetical protein
MTQAFTFLLAPEHAQLQDIFPRSNRKNISVGELKQLIEAGGSYWGDGTIGGRLFFAEEIDGRARPIAPELTIHHRNGLGFQFFLAGRACHGECSIALRSLRTEEIDAVPLDCGTPIFVPSNAFFQTIDSIGIVQEYLLLRGDISKSAYRWLTVREEEADFERKDYWVDQARKSLD